MKYSILAFIVLLISSNIMSQVSLLKDINPGSKDGFINSIHGFKSWMIPLDDNVVFTAKDEVHGEELWVTDGTIEGTKLLLDIYDGAESSLPRFPIVFNGKVFFFAATKDEGVELWVTDGTSVGTFLVKDIFIGSESSRTINHKRYTQIVLGDKLLFTADHKGARGALFSTDGTEMGTVLVKNVCNTCSISQDEAREMSIINNKVYFLTSDDIYESDGTTEGTVKAVDDRRLKEIRASKNYRAINDRLYFQAGRFGDLEPWISDGTQEGTMLIKDIVENGASKPSHFTGFNDKVYFTANRNLYYTEGTADNTKIVDSQLLLRFYDLPQTNDFTVINEDLYFVAATEPTRNSGNLYKISKGVDKISMVQKMDGDIDNNIELVSYNDKIFFIHLEDGELYVLDNEQNSTLKISSINSNSFMSARMQLLTIYKNNMLFFANDGNMGKELWSYKLDSVTNIKVVDQESDFFSFSPNPVRDALTININRTTYNKEPLILSIFNSQGKRLKSIRLNPNSKKYNINVNDIESGIYYITVSGHGFVETDIFIKVAD